VKNP
jgi:hypothetical protein